jgi:hypothetical protein
MGFSFFLENISNLSKTSLTLTSSSELTKEIANNNSRAFKNNFHETEKHVFCFVLQRIKKLIIKPDEIDDVVLRM